MRGQQLGQRAGTMPAIVATGTVVKPRALKIAFAEQGAIDDGMLPLAGPALAAVRADLELREIGGNLFGDQGLLHAVQNGLGFRERQAQFLRPQRTAFELHDVLDFLATAVFSINRHLYACRHLLLLSAVSSVLPDMAYCAQAVD